MPGPRYDFIILVKDRGQNNIRILQYINRNIKTINAMGIFLSITKICEADFDRNMVNKLHSRGIMNLPALITHKGKIYEGMNKIQTLFNNNIVEFQQFQGKKQPPKEDYRDETGGVPDPLSDVSSYQRFIIDPKNDKGGGDEDDDADRNKIDIERKMREYMANPPKHRVQQRTGQENGGNGGGGGGRGGRPMAPPSAGGRRRREPEENIAAPDTARDDLTHYVGVGDHDDYTQQDEIMERAYWGNQNATNVSYNNYD